MSLKSGNHIISKMQAILFPDSLWQPVSGWNNTFMSHDKVFCQNVFNYLHFDKKVSKTISEKYAMMAVMKLKYKNLKYSNQDEQMLKSLVTG